MRSDFKQIDLEEGLVIMHSDDDFAHYGVLGMKWGVRKDPDRAYSKASKKLRKFDTKYARYSEKSSRTKPNTTKLEARKNKYDAKRSKLESKASRARYKADTAILFPNSKEEKARKAERKLARFKAKAEKADAKFARANYKQLRTDAKMKRNREKAIKWYKSMEKTFKDIELSNASEEDIALGKYYAEMIGIRERR